MGFSPIKPNIGGLKLKSNFSTAKLAANISANKSSAATMVKNGYSTYGTNLFFTPANRVGGGTPRYASASQLSRALNGTNVRYRGSVPSYSGVSYTQNVTQGMSSFEKGMAIASVGLTVLKALGDLGIIGGAKSQGAVSNSAQLDAAANGLGGTTNVSGNFATSLSSATSFSQINKIESDISKKKATLNTDYQKIGTDAQNGIKDIMGSEGVSDGFKLAGVQLDTNALQLSELNPQDLEGSLKTIEKDINNFGTFKSTTLPEAKNKITGKSGQIDGTLTAKNGELERLKASNKDGVNDSAISKLEKEIDELKKQKEQLKAAETAIDKITKECDGAIDDLKSKKSEITDIKKTEDGMKDKKYDLAKSQDKELKSRMDQINKLNKEISSLQDKNPDKYDKSDDKRAAKMSSLMYQRTTAFKNLGQLVSSLSAAGVKEFENSKGSKYTIQNLENANSILSNQSGVEGQSKGSSTVVTPKPEGNKGHSSPEVSVTGSLANVKDNVLLNMLNNPDNADQKDAITAELARRGVKIQDGYGRKNAAGVDWSSMAIGSWNEYTS